MARKKKEPSSLGEAKTDNSQPTTVAQDVKLEVVKPPTLEELESDIEKAWTTFRESAWAFAVAVTALHGSKLYPHAGEPDGFYTYMEKRWGIKKAQAANYVAWVKDEIKMELRLQNPALEDIKSTQVDSNVTPPPETPKNKGPVQSRNARSSKRVRGKLNEQDAQELESQGNVVRIGTEYYSKGTPQFEAEMARRGGKKMVWVADYLAYSNSWEYKQIPLNAVLKGSAVYASKEEAEAAKKPVFLVVQKDNQWTVKVDEGTTEDNSVPEYHRFSREDRAREHADRTQKFNEAASKAEALNAKVQGQPQEEMVWVVNYFPYVNNSWEYKQIPLNAVLKGSAVYASKEEAEADVAKQEQADKKKGAGILDPDIVQQALLDNTDTKKNGDSLSELLETTVLNSFDQWLAMEE